MTRHRFGIWLLLPVKHLHHPIQGCGIRYHSPTCQYPTRDIDVAMCTVVGKVLWQIGANKYGWRHNHGHHPTHHYPYIGTGLHHRLHLPRLLRGFLRPVPRHVLLFTLKKKFHALGQLRKQSRCVASRHSSALTVVEGFECVGHGIEDVPLGAHTRSALSEVFYQYSLHAVIDLGLREWRHLACSQCLVGSISLNAQLHQAAEDLLHVLAI